MTHATLSVMGLFRRDDLPVAPDVVPVIPERTNRAQAASYNAPRAITASAERIKIDTVHAVDRSYATWQAEAWTGYERVGEIHYGFGLLANLLSRVRIYGAAVGEPNEAPLDAPAAAKENRISSELADAVTAAMEDLTKLDFASMVRKYSLNMSVPGELYLVYMPVARGSEERYWAVCSTDEIQIRSTGAEYIPIRNGSPAERRMLPPDTFIARIWRQNPRYTKEPDSSMVGVADSVEELLLCQRLVRGAARSRMNAGILFMPDGVTTAGPAGVTAEPVLEEGEDPVTHLAQAAQQDPGGDILAQLMSSMTTPIGDEGSAAGVVPMLLTGPENLGAAIRHVTFERASDEWLVKRAEAALDRILSGIDIPKEIVTGLQQVKYSNAVVIDENLYKANIEPLALVLADSLTDVYLRPVLKAKGFTDEELQKVVIWYDPSEIVTRPNSADDATEGLDRYVLSPRAWRREHGFAESDAPSEEELSHLLLTKINALPDNILEHLLKKMLGKMLDDLPEPEEVPDNLRQFPQAVPGTPAEDKQAAKPPADPQATAIKQVGKT